MREREARRMQCLALKSVQRRPERGRGTRRNAPAAAIHRIADDGITGMREVDADLVRASGLEAHACERMRAVTFLDAIVRHGRATVAAYRHLDALGAMAADGFVDGAAA